MSGMHECDVCMCPYRYVRARARKCWAVLNVYVVYVCTENVYMYACSLCMCMCGVYVCEVTYVCEVCLHVRMYMHACTCV